VAVLSGSVLFSCYVTVCVVSLFFHMSSLLVSEDNASSFMPKVNKLYARTSPGVEPTWDCFRGQNVKDQARRVYNSHLCSVFCAAWTQCVMVAIAVTTWLSVTLMYCAQMTGSVIIWLSRDCSPAILVFWCQVWTRWHEGSPTLKVSKQRGVGKKSQKLSLFIEAWLCGDVDQSRHVNVTLSSINSAWHCYGPVIVQFICSAYCRILPPNINWSVWAAYQPQLSFLFKLL